RVPFLEVPQDGQDVHAVHAAVGPEVEDDDVAAQLADADRPVHVQPGGRGGQIRGVDTLGHTLFHGAQSAATQAERHGRRGKRYSRRGEGADPQIISRPARPLTACRSACTSASSGLHSTSVERRRSAKRCAAGITVSPPWCSRDFTSRTTRARCSGSTWPSPCTLIFENQTRWIALGFLLRSSTAIPMQRT